MKIQYATLAVLALALVLTAGCLDDGQYYTKVGTVDKVLNHDATISSGPCTVRLTSGEVFDVRYFTNCVNMTEGKNVTLTIYQRYTGSTNLQWVELAERAP
jgi:hypothetical protein